MSLGLGLGVMFVCGGVRVCVGHRVVVVVCVCLGFRIRY